MSAEELAQAFHEAYERLAPSFGYETRGASARPWSNVPEANKLLMIARGGGDSGDLSLWRVRRPRRGPSHRQQAGVRAQKCVTAQGRADAALSDTGGRRVRVGARKPHSGGWPPRRHGTRWCHACGCREPECVEATRVAFRRYRLFGSTVARAEA